MSARRRLLRWSIPLLACAATGLGLSFGLAQPAKSVAPEQLLPANAFLYFNSAGLDDHEAGWKKTASYEALSQGGVYALLEKVLDAVGKRADPKLASLVRNSLQTVVRKGVSLAVGVTQDDAGPPLPFAVAVLHQGGKLKSGIGGYLKNAAGPGLDFADKTISGRVVTRAMIPNSPGIEIGWWVEGEHLVFAFGANAVAEALSVATGKSPNITTSPLWKKYRETNEFELTSLSWLDVGLLRKTYGEMPMPAPGLDATFGQIADAFGFGNVGAVVGRGGFQGRANWTDSLIELSGPPQGLLAIMAQSKMGLSDLPALPTDTSGFTAFTFDLDKVVDVGAGIARKLAKLGPDKSDEVVDGVIDALPLLIGFDLRKDLFEPLGDVVCLYDDSQGGMLGMGLTVAIEVDNAEKLRTTIDDLLDRLEEAARDKVKISRAKKPNCEIIRLTLSERGREIPFGLSFAIDDKWLVASMMPQQVEAFALRQGKQLPAWQPDGEFAEPMKSVPKTFTSLTVTNPRKTYTTLLGIAPILVASMELGARPARFDSQPEDEFHLPITSADFPPAEVFTQPLFPNVSFTTVDEAGIHSASRVSLPLVPFMEGLGTIGAAGWLLAPDVRYAREAARKVESKSHLKNLGIAIHSYASTNGGTLPQGARPNDDLKLEKRLSWLVAILPELDHQNISQALKLDEAWDSETNAPLTKLRVTVFLNPNLPEGETKFASTHYVGIAGVGAESLTAKKHDKKTGIFGYDRKTRFEDVTDGLSQTLMVTESKEPSPWGEAKSSIRALTKKPYFNGPDGLGVPRAGGMHILMGDGSVRFISEKIDAELLEKLATAQGGEPIDDF